MARAESLCADFGLRAGDRARDASAAGKACEAPPSECETACDYRPRPGAKCRVKGSRKKELGSPKPKKGQAPLEVQAPPSARTPI